ncbi:uncharacterized protein LOC103982087 [Musa acuminata AAA Group]|uniref:uncharacterized protein LOC103982087 n=1 Tax=Musa acuminata AAA Group TaxID=214697 RepID=UPI0031D31EE0
MGLVSGLVDAAVVLFSGVLTVAVPLIDAQVCLPEWLYPAPLLELKRWYGETYGDYLMAEKPHFFTGLVWVEIAFLWPLSLANFYGILARRPWAATTSLMAGVSIATSMAAIMAELLGSGRASDQLLRMYVPFGVFALLAILRGLFSRAKPRRPTATSHVPTARKKRA